MGNKGKEERYLAKQSERMQRIVYRTNKRNIEREGFMSAKQTFFGPTFHVQHSQSMNYDTIATSILTMLRKTVTEKNIFWKLYTNEE